MQENMMSLCHKLMYILNDLEFVLDDLIKIIRERILFIYMWFYV